MNFTQQNQQNRGFNTPNSFFPNNPTNFNNQYNPNPNMNGPYTGSPITFNQSTTFDAYVSYIRLIFDQIRVYHLNQQLSEITEYVNHQQDDFLKKIEECTKKSEVVELQEAYENEIKNRCLALKNQNQQNLRLMFQIKEKIIRCISPYVEMNPHKEQQFNIVHDRIKRMKYEIITKLNMLRSRKVVGERNKVRGKQKIGLDVPLGQLKDATQFINRQIIKQREEIGELIRQLYGNVF